MLFFFYMEKANKKVINFRPIFFCFVSLLFALTTIRYVLAGDASYIVLDCIVFFGGGLYFLLRQKFAILLLLLCSFTFGVGWHFVGIATFNTHNYTDACQVVGRISDDLTFKDEYAYTTLKDVKINGKNEKNISLSIYYDGQDFAIGDVISFVGYLKQAKLFELGSFNSSYYRSRIGYTGSVNFDDVFIINHRTTFAEKIRMIIKDTLYQKMGKENGSVAYAVLFGDKSGIDAEVKGTYKTAGIVHILAVSGLHVSLLLAFLGFVLKKCKVKGWLNLLICGIILLIYAYLCGFSPSIVRAGIMGMVLLFALVSGKWYDGLNSLSLAGILILLFNSLSAHDVGFLMSFACVFAIFTIYPIISKWLGKFLPKRFADAIAISISAELGILPFLAKIFSSFNVLSFVLNLIVLPIFGVLYPLLLVSVILTLVFGFMGFLLNVCGFGFTAIYKIANVFANPLFLIELSPLKIYVTSAFFVLLFVASRYLMTSKKAKLICVATMLALTCGLWGISLAPISADASISFCTKYQNNVILLTNKHKESVIINLSNKNFTRQVLFANGVSKVIAVFGLDSSSITEQTWEALKKPTLILNGSGLGFDGEVVFETNIVGNVGHFSFSFMQTGLQITFDDTKVFVLANKSLTTSQMNSIASRSYDFVISNKKNVKTEMFSGATNVVSYYQSAGTDWSYLKNGNGTYNLGNKKWRCLD